MKLVCSMMLALMAGALCAQATLPVSGSISGVDQRSLLVAVNFGGTPQSVQLDLSIAATGGTSGLLASIFDLDELALNGSATSIISDFDAGTGTINISLTTATYSGVVDFMLGIGTDSGFGTSPYSGNLTCTTLTAGSLVAGASQIIQQPINSVTFVHNRLTYGNRDSSAQVAYEFNVNYGPTAHPITYYLQGSGDVGGTITVSELDIAGNPLTNLTVTDTTAFLLENNGSTSPRLGTVRFRITITPSAFGTFDWSIAFPSSVTISALPNGGGGDGGGNEEGCSTAEPDSFGLLALLGTLGLLVLARTACRENASKAVGSVSV